MDLAAIAVNFAFEARVLLRKLLAGLARSMNGGSPIAHQSSIGWETAANRWNNGARGRTTAGSTLKRAESGFANPQAISRTGWRRPDHHGPACCPPLFVATDGRNRRCRVRRRGEHALVSTAASAIAITKDILMCAAYPSYLNVLPIELPRNSSMSQQ